MASSRNICAITVRKQQLKLCPYRNELPPTADDFLWGNSMFNTLGRFKGMNDEMGFIVTAFARRISAVAGGGRDRRHRAATGRRRDRRRHHGWIPHTYGIIEHYIPAQLKPMRAARQQHWDIDFAAVNWIHVPVALVSMLRSFAMFAAAIWRRRLDDLDAARRDRVAGAARQRLHLRRDIGTA